MSKILPAAKCSQMSNPKAATGSGGDRCVEATLAMIDATYKLGPHAKKGVDPEQLMYEFTEAWNNGSDVSAPESGRRIEDFVNGHKGFSVSTLPGNFANLQTIVDRGHIAYAGVKDYRKLHLLGGLNPYQWNPDTQHGTFGHVLLLVGYGDGVVVHDPLRSVLTGMPAEYSVTSFEAAGWDVIGEIVGPRLDTPPPPADQTHIIRPGETMWALAEHFYAGVDPAVSVLWIEHANPDANPRMLHIGSTLVIPAAPKGK